jgi:type IV secretory pathway VirB10-like protein
VTEEKKEKKKKKCWLKKRKKNEKKKKKNITRPITHADATPVIEPGAPLPLPPALAPDPRPSLDVALERDRAAETGRDAEPDLALPCEEPVEDMIAAMESDVASDASAEVAAASGSGGRHICAMRPSAAAARTRSADAPRGTRVANSPRSAAVACSTAGPTLASHG